MPKQRYVPKVVFCFVLACVGRASAQPSVGSIAGVVRDTTGAVLPGVTVEASSSALIEKVRAAATDGDGQYKIVNLPPGTYAVTFSLSGFSATKREGIELSAGFTAQVNGELRVGAVEETITVAGANPVIDTQNVRQQTVLTAEVMETIPITHTQQGFAALTLGASVPATRQDVGGNTGEFVAAPAIHGVQGPESLTLVDGMTVQLMYSTGSGGLRQYHVNKMAEEEVVLQTGAASAESEAGGMVTNIVPKGGGNAFRFTGGANYTGSALQSDNLNDDLRAQGLTKAPGIKKMYDIGAAAGGPVVRDRLWYFVNSRRWNTEEQQTAQYHNLTPHTLFYNPDLNAPAVTDNLTTDVGFHGTWQVSPKNKITGLYSYQPACACPFNLNGGAPRAFEAAPLLHYYSHLSLVSWTLPATNRLLFEAGVGYLKIDETSLRGPSTTPDDISITEQTTGITYGAYVTALNAISDYTTGPDGRDIPIKNNTFSTHYSASYVTGSHAFKFGLRTVSGLSTYPAFINHDVSYTFSSQKPLSITQWATPGYGESRVRLNLGLFAQDQWTFRRLTANVGLRFDHLNGYNPAQLRPAGQFVAALPIAEQDNLPNWKDVSPRLGAALDVFGSGHTVVKGFVGRYVSLDATSIASAANPANAIVTNATRTWNDLTTFPAGDPRNGNFVPDCDLKNPDLNGECGALSPRTFGTVQVSTNYANDVTQGWSTRPYIWQSNLSIQQQVRSGFAVAAGYYRSSYGNFRITNNLAVTPADFDPYCVTAPTDPRLGSVSGSSICGLYDISPTAFGATNNLVTQASNYGKMTQTYNGFDVSVNARLGGGRLLSGGVSTGNTVADNCDVVLSQGVTGTTVVGGSTAWISDRRYCRQTLSWEHQLQVKLSGAYPIPFWDLQGAIVYQNLAGIPVTASLVATNAQIFPSLGRNLGQCRGAATCTSGSVTINNLIEPNSQFLDRLNQIDARLSKRMSYHGTQIIGSIEAFNLFNSSYVTSITTRYGASWQQPLSILAGRLVKLGVQVSF